ncbi:unnamed protein product, partial [Urochloa humidicola]
QRRHPSLAEIQKGEREKEKEEGMGD